MIENAGYNILYIYHKNFTSVCSRKNNAVVKFSTRIWVLLFLLLSLSSGQAQDIQRDTILFNTDGSVTFQYRGPETKSVKVRCDCKLRREKTIIKKENYHSVKMVRDSSGRWTYTTPPLAQEVYTYQFESDGARFPDPSNPDSIRVRTEQMSVFTVGGSPQTDLYTCYPLRGRMDTLEFKSRNEAKARRLIVYLPPEYADSTQDFPVLYLLHGLNGDEKSWNERGRAVQILDNLIAMRKAKPMILVMPNANPQCLISEKKDIGLGKNIMLYPTWGRREFERQFSEMDSFLCSRYRLLSQPGSRAVAGLSAGGKQAANLAVMYCGTFSSVGMFSPVVGHRQIPDSCYTKYWIGGGTGDLFHRRINKFRRRLQRNHIYYTMYNSKGGHTWRNWRVYFTDYVQTLFWN